MAKIPHAPYIPDPSGLLYHNGSWYSRTGVKLDAGVSSTFAALPTPVASLAGASVFVTDVGVYGSYWYTDGTNWLPKTPVMLFESNIPFIWPTSFTMGNNGAISGLTSLTITYSVANSNGCYIYLPASGIAAGSAAGWYYAIMSSATAGTVYNNTYTTGIPTVPASPTAFSTVGPGAVAATTTIILGPNFTLPANVVATGKTRIQFEHQATYSGDTNSKVITTTIEGALLYSITNTTAANVQIYTSIRHTLNSAGKVISRQGVSSGSGPSTSAPSLLTFDFTVNRVIGMNGTTANVASFIVIPCFAMYLV